MIAKRAGKCTACDSKFLAGSEIGWCRASKTIQWCPSCEHEPKSQRTSAGYFKVYSPKCDAVHGLFRKDGDIVHAYAYTGKAGETIDATFSADISPDTVKQWVYANGEGRV